MFAPSLDSLVNNLCCFAKTGIKSELSVCLCSNIKNNFHSDLFIFFCFVVDKLPKMIKPEFVFSSCHEMSTFYTT